MKSTTVKLSQVKVNSANPRTIKDHKLNQLAERMLVFPKMITIRPVVVDDKMVSLGGNMRIKALNLIAGKPFDEVAGIITATKNYKRLTQGEQQQLLEHWKQWLESPTVEIVKASELSESEKKEFVIADNASFGEWDYDRLANEWDADDVSSWGVDVWKPTPSAPGWDGQAEQPAQEPVAAEPQVDTSALPPELQGVDINPDNLPKIEGTGETLMERIIIVYPKDRAAEVAQLVGLEAIEKVVYNIDEIIKAE